MSCPEFTSLFPRPPESIQFCNIWLDSQNSIRSSILNSLAVRMFFVQVQQNVLAIFLSLHLGAAVRRRCSDIKSKTSDPKLNSSHGFCPRFFAWFCPKNISLSLVLPRTWHGGMHTGASDTSMTSSSLSTRHACYRPAELPLLSQFISPHPPLPQQARASWGKYSLSAHFAQNQ